MPGVKVEAGAVVTRALVAEGVKIGREAVVGCADSEIMTSCSKMFDKRTWFSSDIYLNTLDSAVAHVGDRD